MILGFTGTRQELTSEQKHEVLNYMLDNHIEVFHHGCCVGADEFSHRAAKNCLDLGLEKIALHPPTDHKFEMSYDKWDYDNCVWYPRAPYLERNRSIVSECDRLLVCPKRKSERFPGPSRGSGTWYTARNAYANRKQIIIIYPDGEIVPLREPHRL